MAKPSSSRSTGRSSGENADKHRPRFQPGEEAAVTDVQRAALIAVFGLLMTSVSLAVYLGPQFDVSPQSGNYNLSNLYTGAALLGVGVALGAVAIALYWKAFRHFRTMNRRFATPARFAPLALLGLIGAAAAVIGVVLHLGEWINCSGLGSPINSECVNTEVIGFESLLVVSVLILLVGGVSILVGFWRLGDRYHSSLFHVGAILEIFPYIGFLGALCIFLGATGVRRQRGALPVEPAKDEEDEDDSDDDSDDD
jgi:hypothetical protein